MRYGFVTCVELGLACIEEIYAIGGHLDLLITLEDHRARSKSGRIYLDDIASKHDVPLLKIGHINDPDVVAAVRDAALDWLFVIGWSQIAGSDLLQSPRRGAIGMHPTLLPEGRGRAAVPWAIIKGLSRTGVSMFVLDEGVDTGPVIAQVELPIGEREDATSLYHRANEAHRALIREAWPLLASGKCEPQPQDDSAATVWPGRSPEDGLIEPGMSTLEVDRLVRGVTHPYPGAIWVEPGEQWRVWAGRPGTHQEAVKVIALSDGPYSLVDAVPEFTTDPLD